MSVVSTGTIEIVEETREPAAPVGRGQVIAIVAIGYLIAAGVVASALLLPAG